MMTHTSSVNLGTNVACGEEYITSLFSRVLYNHMHACVYTLPLDYTV